MNNSKIIEFLQQIPVISLIALSVSIISIVISWNSYTISRANLIISTAPKLAVAQIHIWDAGRGGPQQSDNQLPTIESDQKIEGIALIINIGSNAAFVEGSNFRAVWRKKPLNMINPLWQPGRGQLIFATNAHSLKSGQEAKFKIDTKVPQDETEKLYILGHINYRDAANVFRKLYFARYYSAERGIFVETEDTKAFEDMQ